MGHTELGVLPKSAKWLAVTQLLAAPETDVARVAESTATAAAGRLTALRGDPSISYCFWLLTRLAAAARGDLLSTNGPCHEREAIGECAIFQGQNLRRDGLYNGDSGQCRADEYTATYEHAHRCRFGRDHRAYEGNYWWYGCQELAIKNVGKTADDGGQHALHEERTL